MKIVSVKIKNYRTFEFLEIKNVPSFCVIIGANGTGKSTLFDVFGFIQDSLRCGLRQALQIRGGFNKVVTVGREQEDIEIEIGLCMEVMGIESPITYILIVGKEERERVVVKKEILSHKIEEYCSPYHFLDFQHGKGYAIAGGGNLEQTDEELEWEELQLESNDTLAIKALGQFKRFRVINTLSSLVENWHFSDIRIKDVRGSKVVSYVKHLTPTGDNLAVVAQYIYQYHPDIFESILSRMREIVPGISGVEVKETEDGRLILRFQDQSFKDPFTDYYVSDGTIRMFAYLILLFDPNPHHLLCVGEPENQLHPNLHTELAEEFANYASLGGQVFVSTHSPNFLDAVPLESIFWLTKEGGVSKIFRASDNETLNNLVKSGNLFGDLWRQGWLDTVAPAPSVG
jgi:predicted ATPase